jgi:hypothetical protein
MFILFSLFSVNCLFSQVSILVTITCPPNIIVAANSSCIAMGVNLGLPTTGGIVASLTNNAPGAFPLGTTPVTWVVSDNSGNTASCIQLVTVVDSINPNITVPSNQIRCVDVGYNTYTVVSTEFNSLSASDNCLLDSISYILTGATSGSSPTPLTGTHFNIGITTVTWTATDAAGNTATASFTVTVNTCFGMTENSNNSIIHIFPNPASDKITIDFTDRQHSNLYIYNIVGQLVLSKELDNARKEIDISTLPTGLYSIKVTGADWTVQKKMIKE